MDPTFRSAARVVGGLYLLMMATALFAEFYVRGNLITYGDAASTARNLLAHDRLYRLGIASDLFTFACIVPLLTALYVILKPVNRNLALLAAFWRLLEASLCVVATLRCFDVLGILNASADSQTFSAGQLQAQALLAIDAHGAAYNVGLIFFGLGSTVFSYLWLKSAYIPKALALWGILSSMLVAVGAFTFTFAPELQVVSFPWIYIPIMGFEITMGFLLLFKGLRMPSPASR